MNSSAGTIKAARIAAKLTQVQLAQRVGVHVASVRNWEKGSVPSARLAQKIAEAVGVDKIEVGTKSIDPLMELQIADITKGLHKKLAAVHGVPEDRIEITIRILSKMPAETA
jgi:transcriptional regulator with XRE-family HTH domain